MFQIVLVGRPNVGKSTLFNRLVGPGKAIVNDQPGVTRDRKYGQVSFLDLEFMLVDTAGIDDSLKGNTAIMFGESTNAPAKIIKEFRKKQDKPVLKSAFIEESFYFGDDQVEVLCSLKSKDELIGEIIGLLQSPPKTVISSLQSAGGTLSGILKTLSERSE